MTTALEDLAMIGDGETVALVSRKGSVEWLCLPRFDSAACCAALLGNGEHGYWSIAPRGPITGSEQRYASDTLVLETDLSSEEGTIRITDFMPIRDDHPTLIRIVEGLEGTVEVSLHGQVPLRLRQYAAWITTENGRVTMHVGPDKLILWGLEDARSPWQRDTRIPGQEG